MRNKSKFYFGKLKYLLPAKHLSGDVTEQLRVLVLAPEGLGGLNLGVISIHRGLNAMAVVRPPRIRI